MRPKTDLLYSVQACERNLDAPFNVQDTKGMVVAYAFTEEAGQVIAAAFTAVHAANFPNPTVRFAELRFEVK